MYHGLTTKASQVNDYFIPAETFEDDAAWLKEHGYTAVTMQDLIDFVYDKTGKESLPEKPVVITFDDGYYNNHKYATPVLKKYGMKAVPVRHRPGLRGRFPRCVPGRGLLQRDLEPASGNGRFRPVGNTEPYL